MATPPLVADADALTIWLLDMGTEQYGDCLVCRRGSRTILIDGGHPGDFQDRNGFKSIPHQLTDILNEQPPFDIDLLVVTHCHRDHIGCLPALVADGVLNVDRALVADEILGFGHIDDHVSDAPDTVKRLAAALREEDHSNLDGADLDAFLADAATLEDKYNDMLRRLKQAGTTIVRYGRNSHAGIETAFQDFGLEILGPTKAHLEICAHAIASFTDSAADLVRRQRADAAVDVAALYRDAVRQTDAAAAFTADRPGKGAALNDQSIVLKLTVNGKTALLGGDMQFAKPEVSGLNTAMSQLRTLVKNAAPYNFIKTFHHTSYNGVNDSLLDSDWSATRAFAHSGGINDATHPDETALQQLEARKSHLRYARTDRNGLIKVTLGATGVRMTASRGDLDDFSPNGDVIGQEPEEQGEGEAAGTGTLVGRMTTAGGLTEVTATARLGSDVSRVTISFELDRDGAPRRAQSQTGDPRGRRRPGAEGRQPASTGGSGRLASGRALPRLLFVTYRPRLENNVGSTEAASALGLITAAGQRLVEVRNQESPFAEIRRALASGYDGVVIVGGYDVLPAQRLDALPPSLRTQLGTTTADADNFVIWNDDVYGDRDGDGLPEIPMSRIPDAKSVRLLTAALTAAASNGSPRFGIRNVARPFAAQTYANVPGTGAILVSEPAVPATVGAGNADGSAVYVMLHGSDADASRFWGEDDGSTIEAMNLTNIPRTSSGVVFAGCCWGALTVQTTARQSGAGTPLGVRTPGTSIALSYLHAGARAFVGCTGTHYSPTVAPYGYFGGPMHSAFWTRVKGGAAPARALFDAKLDYLQNMPHGQTSGVAQAIEFKTLKQFTCLGLGW